MLVLGVMVGVILAGLMTRSDMDRILWARFPPFKMIYMPILLPAVTIQFSITQEERKCHKLHDVKCVLQITYGLCVFAS